MAYGLASMKLGHEPRGWRKWPTATLENVLDGMDDSTELYDKVQDELDKRHADHEVKVNNGGVMP